MTNIENPFKKKIEEAASQIEVPKEVESTEEQAIKEKNPPLLKRNRNRPPAEDAFQEIAKEPTQKESPQKTKTTSIPIFKPKAKTVHTPVSATTDEITTFPEITKIPIIETDEPIILSSDGDNSDNLEDYESLLDELPKTPQNSAESQTEAYQDQSLITESFLDEVEEVPLLKNNVFSIKDRKATHNVSSFQQVSENQDSIPPTVSSAEVTSSKSKFSNVFAVVIVYIFLYIRHTSIHLSQ